MVLPEKIEAPSADWADGFPRAAADFAEYPRKYWDLDAALAYCGTCLDEILSGVRTNGKWDPVRSCWQ